MNLKSILVGIEGLKAKGNLNLEISSVECDYRAVKKGSLFVAIKGFEVDGHSFINKAIENGVTEKDIPVFECSHCKVYIHTPRGMRLPYTCPSCGTKMENGGERF